MKKLSTTRRGYSTTPSKEDLCKWFHPKKDDNIHYVWHNFSGKFHDKNKRWKFSGWKLMRAVERWAKKFPTEVQVIWCDDRVYASSNLVLIEHRSKIDYHGTTVVYIPQCTGEQPIAFFLYPNHRKMLMEALKALGKVRGGVL